MDFDAEVHLLAHRFPVEPYSVDSVLHFLHVGFEIGDVPAVVQEGGQVADGCEALGFGVDAALDQLRLCLPKDVIVDPRLVPHFAAHKLVGGHAQMLARNVPERDVDGTERAHNRRAPEVAPAVEILPVVFNAQRVLPDEVALECLHRAGRGFQKAPRA